MQGLPHEQPEGERAVEMGPCGSAATDFRASPRSPFGNRSPAASVRSGYSVHLTNASSPTVSSKLSPFRSRSYCEGVRALGTHSPFSRLSKLSVEATPNADINCGPDNYQTTAPSLEDSPLPHGMLAPQGALVTNSWPAIQGAVATCGSTDLLHGREFSTGPPPALLALCKQHESSTPPQARPACSTPTPPEVRSYGSPTTGNAPPNWCRAPVRHCRAPLSYLHGLRTPSIRVPGLRVRSLHAAPSSPSRDLGADGSLHLEDGASDCDSELAAPSAAATYASPLVHSPMRRGPMTHSSSGSPSPRSSSPCPALFKRRRFER